MKTFDPKAKIKQNKTKTLSKHGAFTAKHEHYLPYEQTGLSASSEDHVYALYHHNNSIKEKI